MEFYNGVPVFARKGLHSEILTHLRKAGALLQGMKACDLACGAGAFTQRLLDADCISVDAVDLVSDNFSIISDRVKFIHADLNGGFSAILGSNKYDLVVALEIIEHLENPRNFIHEATTVLRTGGWLVISTPNIESSSSLAEFALSGKFPLFSEGHYRTLGHITPVSRWQLEKMVTEQGIRALEWFTFSPDRIRFWTWRRLFLLSTMLRVLRGPNSWEGAALGLIAVRN